ncbi:MAG: hypothetical protein K2L85_08295, partial [Paramuribaculum sp.]|nr:hypothetical protein [Paramuribaculum sp.]
MRNKIIFTALLANAALLPALAETRNLAGAWVGPNDLIVTICTDNDSIPSVCYCGIYRTIGWVDVRSEINGDSLIMTAEHAGSPLEGRFRIVSDERMTGTLSTGNPDESWFFTGPAELTKQKPYMPENLNHDLEGIIRPSDYGILSLDRAMAREILSTLSPQSYGYAEKTVIEKLLDAKTTPVTPDDMIG